MTVFDYVEQDRTFLRIERHKKEVVEDEKGKMKRIGRLFYSHSDCVTSKDVF